MDDIQAVILAGGKGKRLGIDLPKCMLEINKKRLIDICIENLIANNIKEYVFLVGYQHNIVISHLTKYSNMNIRYSIDKEDKIGWGKGKAFKYALINNAIDKKKRSLIVFPDDIIRDVFIYKRFIDAHLDAVKKYDVLASVLLVSGSFYPYGVAKLTDNNIVYQFEEKPFIEIPTNTGMYIFEPGVYDLAIQKIDLDYPDAVELEDTVIPILAKMRKLNGFMMDANNWLPINTRKDYEYAQIILAKANTEAKNF